MHTMHILSINIKNINFVSDENFQFLQLKKKSVYYVFSYCHTYRFYGSLKGCFRIKETFKIKSQFKRGLSVSTARDVDDEQIENSSKLGVLFIGHRQTV